MVNNLQNHSANLAPAKIAKPIITGAKNAAKPMIGFGKPKSVACAVSITDLHEMNGFMSQESVAFGSAATWIRSSTSENEATQPSIPVQIMVKATPRLGDSTVSIGTVVFGSLT